MPCRLCKYEITDILLWTQVFHSRKHYPEEENEGRVILISRLVQAGILCQGQDPCQASQNNANPIINPVLTENTVPKLIRCFGFNLSPEAPPVAPYCN